MFSRKYFIHYSGQKQVKSIKTKTTQQPAENTSCILRTKTSSNIYKKNLHTKFSRKYFMHFSGQKPSRQYQKNLYTTSRVKYFMHIQDKNQFDTVTAFDSQLGWNVHWILIYQMSYFLHGSEIQDGLTIHRGLGLWCWTLFLEKTKELFYSKTTQPVHE